MNMEKSYTRMPLNRKKQPEREMLWLIQNVAKMSDEGSSK